MHTHAQPAGPAPARTRPQAYPIRGTLSEVRQISPQAVTGKLRFTTRAGQTHVVTACAYGRAVVLVGRQFRNGPTHLFGHFDNDRFIAYCEAYRPPPADLETREPATAAPAAAEPSTRATPEEPVPVGAHWKMQPYGPGRTLRRKIRVSAYHRHAKA